MSTDTVDTDPHKEIVERYQDALWRLTAGYERQRADREDLYQEILLAVWRALPRFRGNCSERTFVYRVAHNRGITHRARARRARSTSLDDAPTQVDPREGPESRHVALSQTAALHVAVRKLRLAYREPVLLRLEGLGSSEIAEVMGISANNVDVRLSRARQMLRETLRKQASR